MNWRCFFGDHDWHRIASKLKRDIVDEAFVGSGFTPDPITVLYGSKEMEQKICLRCGKKVDEIGLNREYVLAQLAAYKRREQLAKEMWSK